MAHHFVTCVYCKCTFDRDVEPTTAVSARRYAHKACADKFLAKKTQDEKDYENLANYIKKLFNTSYVSAKIQRQIKDYKEKYNYTFEGMLKTLEWWYDLCGNSIEKANDGIGIIPFIYEDARRYWNGISVARQSATQVKTFKYEIEELEIAPPHIEKKPPKLFNIEDELEE